MKKIIATILLLVVVIGTVVIGVPEEGMRLGFGLNAVAASEADSVFVEMDVISPKNAGGVEGDGVFSIESGVCGENLTWEFTSDNVLTISGTGDMYDYSNELGNYCPWFIYIYELIWIEDPNDIYGMEGDYYCANHVVIEEGVTSVGNYAFNSGYMISDIVLPSTLKRIGDYAIGCRAETITLPAAVTEIGEGAFSGCSRLKNIEVEPGSSAYCDVDGVLFDKDVETLIIYPAGREEESYSVPSTVKEVGDHAFEGYHTPLKEIHFPKIVEKIGAYSFAWNESIENFPIPPYVTSIGDYAFYGSDIKEIVVPRNVTDWGEWTFYKSGLEKITIMEGVTAIPKGTFYYCDLETAWIPSSVKSIGESAFAFGPREVYYAGSEADWNKIDGFHDDNQGLLDATVYFGDGSVKRTLFGDYSVSATLKTGESSVDSSAELVVEEIEDTEKVIEDTLDALGREYSLYDIRFMKNESEIQPSDPVTIRLEMYYDEDVDYDRYKVYSINEDGTYEDRNASYYISGYYVYFTFEADHFSYYALVDSTPRLPGDVDGDGKISLIDSALMRRWLADWWLDSFVEGNADVNNDGKVDMKDSTILRRYLAGWPGVVLK